MKRYLLRRLLMIIPTMFVITFISYMIMDMAPGDPTLAFVDFERQRATKEFLAELKEKLGLVNLGTSGILNGSTEPSTAILAIHWLPNVR